MIATPARPRASERVLAILLLAVEPLGLALWLSGSLLQLGDLGAPALSLLALRAGAVAVGMAAGLQLWNGAPGGLVLGRVALALLMAAALLSAGTRLLPGALPPGVAGPVAAILALFYGGWLLWLTRLARQQRRRG